MQSATEGFADVHADLVDPVVDGVYTVHQIRSGVGEALVDVADPLAQVGLDGGDFLVQVGLDRGDFLVQVGLDRGDLLAQVGSDFADPPA